jgi:hypothetical protein
MSIDASTSVHSWLKGDLKNVFAILDMLVNARDVASFGECIGLTQEQALEADRAFLQRKFNAWIAADHTLGELVNIMTVTLKKEAAFFAAFKELENLQQKREILFVFFSQRVYFS